MAGKSGNSVGKSGRDGYQAPPIDQYRKRIARQDSKKEKTHLRQVKQLHDEKTSNKSYKLFLQVVLHA